VERPAPRAVVVEAARTGRSVRLHLFDGEVVVARVLGLDDDGFVYAALTSSRPERYAVCDSTGTPLAFSDLERAQLLR